MHDHDGLPERFGHLLRAAAAGAVELVALGLFLATILIIAKLIA